MTEQGMLDTAMDQNAKTQKQKSGGQGSGAKKTVNGYNTGEVVSALQKAVRRDEEPYAFFWASELTASGEHQRMWRRLHVMAAEDVGMADPQAIVVVRSCHEASKLSRELNIVFLAVSYLCKAPKNREMDDAAYLYEDRRNEGWKLPIPPEALDQHTQRGKQRIYSLLKQGYGANFIDLAAQFFYFDGGLLRHYVPREDGDRYRKGLMDHLGQPFDTYDIDECSQPRWLSEHTKTVAQSRIPDDIDMEPLYGQEEEPLEGVYSVASFTGQDQRYTVDVVTPSCTCPAFENMKTECKHIEAVRQKTQVV